MDIIIITGMSGSGKSVALHALEDAGYYCVDNLPPELLIPFVKLEEQQQESRLAIAIDVRSAASLHMVPEQLATLRGMGMAVKSLFLDATSDTLLRRYSETRRKHPLSNNRNEPLDHALDLGESIERERQLLGDLRDMALVIDTTHSRSTALQLQIRQLLEVQSTNMTLVFESFAFKKGIPVHADYVFDVRMLPNPHYESHLRPLTGRDAPVQEYLRQSADVERMLKNIEDFLQQWIPSIQKDHRSYVTVAIGCTGGQHRSVYLVETLAEQFKGRWLTLKRHRELDAL